MIRCRYSDAADCSECNNPRCPYIDDPDREDDD